MLSNVSLRWILGPILLRLNLQPVTVIGLVTRFHARASGVIGGHGPSSCAYMVLQYELLAHLHESLPFPSVAPQPIHSILSHHIPRPRARTMLMATSRCRRWLFVKVKPGKSMTPPRHPVSRCHMKLKQGRRAAQISSYSYRAHSLWIPYSASDIPNRV
jgi:hypothetical protein